MSPQSTTSPTVRQPRVVKSRDDYTVGWVCTLHEELAPSITMLEIEHDIPTDIPDGETNTYHLGSIGRHNVVITCLPAGDPGTNSAATVTKQMVVTFPSIRVGLMVGIGGGVDESVRLGDVVVGIPEGIFSGVVQWDLGKVIEEDGTKFERTGMLNKAPDFLRSVVQSVQAENTMGNSKIKGYLDELWEKCPALKSESLKDVRFRADCGHAMICGVGLSCKTDDASKAIPRNGEDKPKVHYGTIASGNRVIKNAHFRDNLSKELRVKVLCVEMEAAGVLTSFPSVIIRGISDYADSHKNSDWKNHAAAVAAAYAKEFLKNVNPRMIRRERPAREILEESGDLPANSSSAGITGGNTGGNTPPEPAPPRWVSVCSGVGCGTQDPFHIHNGNLRYDGKQVLDKGGHPVLAERKTHATGAINHYKHPARKADDVCRTCPSPFAAYTLSTVVTWSCCEVAVKPRDGSAYTWITFPLPDTRSLPDFGSGENSPPCPEVEFKLVKKLFTSIASATMTILPSFDD